MSKAKPPLIRLGDMKAGQSGDFFALLAERTRGARKDGKPFYTSRFSDPTRATWRRSLAAGPLRIRIFPRPDSTSAAVPATFWSAARRMAAPSRCFHAPSIDWSWTMAGTWLKRLRVCG